MQPCHAIRTNSGPGVSSFLLTNGLLGSAPSRFLLGTAYDEPPVDEQDWSLVARIATGHGIDNSNNHSSDNRIAPSEDRTTRVKLQDFEEIRWLGSGNFGRVLLVRQNDTGDIFAACQFLP